MNGFFYIDKQSDWTSRDVCNKVQKIFNLPKVGHIGTLDPFATGLLIVCVGKATKASAYYDDNEKEYVATLKMGKKTSTGDLTGEVVEEKEIVSFTKKDILDVFKSLTGEIEQQIPMTSAVHVNGVKLYQYLHKGVEVDRPTRKVVVKDISLIEVGEDYIVFKATVSKGTYIRVLGEDIASKLNNLGYISSLRRTRIGDVKVEEAKTLGEVKDSDLVSIASLLKDIPSVVLSGERLIKAKNGMTISFDDITKSDRILLIDENNNVIAIYGYDHLNYYKCLRGLY
ncbi:MAG: tRNA pseudouridine(55) synthase TruB [Erysipelotrichaceae bacterium]|nr:tRNA pseudouridine(55) synthase TruB [Erysipelotrichaceae bacterium]